MASVFKKTKSLNVLDSIPGICPYSKIGQTSKVFVSLCSGISEENYLRKMVALMVMSSNRSQQLFTAITQGKENKTPQ